MSIFLNSLGVMLEAVKVMIVVVSIGIDITVSYPISNIATDKC